jgi:alanyl aminopeptidase
MQLDSLVSARQIRQPIESTHDIENAFDDITYEKGMGLLTMLERWLGEETFRRGVNLYMERHRYGNAVADDLLEALSEAAGRDVAAPINSFLLQPGVPLLEVSVHCEGDSSWLALRQSRYLPAGSSGERARTWQIPICVRYAEGRKSFETSMLLDAPEGRLLLESDARPWWVLPNADGAGYYRCALAAADLQRLREAGWSSLSPRERLSVADSIGAAFDSAALPAEDVYHSFEALARDANRSVAVAPMRLIRFAREYLADESLRPQVEAYARRLYRPAYDALGWGPPAGVDEDGESRLLRQQVIEFLVLTGRDPEVRQEAARRGRPQNSSRSR